MKSEHRGAANLLKVRNAVAELMRVEGRCPTGAEVSRETGLSQQACIAHMHTIQRRGWLKGFEVRDNVPLRDWEKNALMDENHGIKQNQFYLVEEAESW